MDTLGGYSVTFPDDITLKYILHGNDRTSTVTAVIARIIITYADGTATTHELSGDRTTVDTMSSILGQTIEHVNTIEIRVPFDGFMLSARYVLIYKPISENLSELEVFGGKYDDSGYIYFSDGILYQVLGNLEIPEIMFDGEFGAG